MRKKPALLSLLMLVSIGAAVIANSSGALGFLAQKGEVKIDEVLIFTKLTPEQKTQAVEVALGDSRIQGILEGEDDYRITVSDVFDIQKTERRIALIPKEGLALVELQIYRDYGQEFGVKVVKVTVELLKGEAMEIEESPEVRKPKVNEGIISTDELLGNPSKYQGQVLRVAGVVSDLGLLRGPYFRLDGKVTVCYLYDDTNIYPTQIKDKIQNGDCVVVTGKFLGDIVYAEKVEKVAS